MSIIQADPAAIEAAFQVLFCRANPALFGMISILPDHPSRMQMGADWVERVPLALMPSTVARWALSQAEGAYGFSRPGCIASPIAALDATGKQIQGLAIVLDMDIHPRQSLSRIREILGPPTLVIRTGTKATFPAGCEPEDRLLVHWRLAQPAMPGDHQELEECSHLACAQTGMGGGCMAPIGAYARWPGTLNRREPGCLASIGEINPEAEVTLSEVSQALRGRGLPVMDPMIRYLLWRNGAQPWLLRKPHLLKLYSALITPPL